MSRLKSRRAAMEARELVSGPGGLQDSALVYAVLSLAEAVLCVAETIETVAERADEDSA